MFPAPPNNKKKNLNSPSPHPEPPLDSMAPMAPPSTAMLSKVQKPNPLKPDRTMPSTAPPPGTFHHSLGYGQSLMWGKGLRSLSFLSICLMSCAISFLFISFLFLSFFLVLTFFPFRSFAFFYFFLRFHLRFGP